ncbi:hypothetical protein IAR55_005837 [Kwoniella newhampshirensis]|uniref:Structure-specific endonuclease subunit SLX4 n=1 Tax=Kwoniella newhampshirensis TaxID=1651941 RepID=A0AAW0YVH4_9TREE
MSSTPRAKSNKRRPRASSTTPTPATQPAPIEISTSSPSEEGEGWEAHGWGDDAVMSWDGGGVEDNGSVSSVGADEAGVELDEDEEEWGREAYLQWGYEGEGGGYSTIDDGQDDDEEEAGEFVETQFADNEDEDEVEVVETESKDQLVARGMPDYSSWELKKLQRLVTGYGYRSSNDHRSLEKVATDCWRAIHPLPSAKLPAPNTAVQLKVARTRESSTTSTSSAEMPLADIKGRRKTATTKTSDFEVIGASSKPREGGVKSKGKGKGKDKEREESVEAIEKVADLSSRFYNMIMGDRELYIRILRYEPISFDELVSKCFAAGLDKLNRSWKKDLKRYLDLQSITYFTEDPTGQRRRH